MAWLALMLAWMPCAQAGEAPVVLYRLPYLEGQAYMFSQAPGGMITTHATRDSLHAVDIPMPEGTPVLAARAGTVIAAESQHGTGAEDDPLTTGGNLVRVRHGDGTIATYAHFMLGGVAVEEGEEVEAGRVLGYSGSTGFASGPHLHFGVSRLERAGGVLQEMSVPVMFYIGKPPVAFAPRAGILVKANYSSPAAPPLGVLEGQRLVEWSPRVLRPEEQAQAWAELAVWLALGLGGMAWFWHFSRS